jgi:hypothetical protein
MALEAKIINPTPPDFNREQERQRDAQETAFRAEKAIRALATRARKSTAYGTGSDTAAVERPAPRMNRKQRRAAAARGRRG